MKTLFTIWLVLSVVLCLSVLGLLLFIPKDTYYKGDSTPSTWCHIGRELLKNIINSK